MLLGGNVRRSSRRVKPRGEREFLVSSDMLLRDLKVMVSLTALPSLNIDHIVTSDNGNFQSCSLRPESHGEWRIPDGESSHSGAAQSPAVKSDISEGESSVSLGKPMFDIICISRLMNLPTVPQVRVKIMSGRIIQRPASKERACLVVNIFLVVIVPILILYSLIQTNVLS